MVVVLYDTTSEREARNAMRGRQPTAAARLLPSDTRTGKGHFSRAVGAYIPKVVAAAFEKFGFHTAEIMTSWETIVGADLGRMTRPESIKWPRGAKSRAGGDEDGGRAAGATLIVACDPAFALEVSYRTQDIVDRINRYFGYRAIAQLRVLQAPQTAEAVSRQREQQVRAARITPQTSLPRAGGDLLGALDALGSSIAGRRAR
jgi:hypothetical protein